MSRFLSRAEQFGLKLRRRYKNPIDLVVERVRDFDRNGLENPVKDEPDGQYEIGEVAPGPEVVISWADENGGRQNDQAEPESVPSKEVFLPIQPMMDRGKETLQSNRLEPLRDAEEDGDSQQDEAKTQR